MKLILLPPGEKLNVEFDEDGVAIGDNASSFSFFLGQQVRNKSVCPIQVKEKWSFDDPEQRRECVMRHAHRLFRYARSKLKRKYFSTPKTKEERLKNKPGFMTKVEWKFLVDYWSNDTIMEKSKKASESRAHQNMPHYNGTKSFGRTRQEIRKKNGGKCSRVDLLLASRTRKSEKAVNAVTLENNIGAVDEINKLKEQRDQGLNEKTDEQIIQDVLGKDKHRYLKAYGPSRSITQHFKVKSSRLDLSEEVKEVKKKANQAVEEARKDAENARTEAEQAKIEAEQAKKEAEAVRNDVDKKIAENNAVWEEKISQLLDFLEAGGSLNNDSGSDGAS
uniref:Transposase, Ptta/En/Spm, plant n=1 Tax=Chenopodium quinoa TaxID=63459 RepID=A0A803N3I4_CHEQI